jgi:hypothetical protein
VIGPRWAALGLGLVASCGGSNGSAADPVGFATAQGAAFVPMDAVSYSGTIAVTDFSGFCAFGLAAAKAGAHYMYFSFDGGSFPLGVTPVGSGVQVQSVAEDKMCGSVAQIAERGTITLSRVDGSGVTGTFDVLFGASEVSGSFTAPSCTDPGDGTCQ